MKSYIVWRIRSKYKSYRKSTTATEKTSSTTLIRSMSPLSVNPTPRLPPALVYPRVGNGSTTPPSGYKDPCRRRVGTETCRDARVPGSFGERGSPNLHGWGWGTGEGRGSWTRPHLVSTPFRTHDNVESTHTCTYPVATVESRGW